MGFPSTTRGVKRKMTGRKGKVITTLRKRHEVEAEIKRMLESSEERDFLARAAHIANYGRQVIPVILKHLDTSDAQLLGVLGTIATYLDVEEITHALRAVATGPNHSDHERMAALLILDRFLNQELDEELFTELRNPQEMAMQSLAEVLAEAEKNRFILLEYIYTLGEQPVEAVLTIMEAMRRLDRGRAVEPLRLLAQDERPPVAERAIQLLGKIRLKEAARALQTLLPAVRPELGPLVERSLLKLRLSGVPVEPLPLPDREWRALVSPPDGEGNRSVWFINERPPCRFLRLLLNDAMGLQMAFGDEGCAAESLPPRSHLGFLHAFIVPESTPVLVMLEADFDYGRHLVLESTARNLESGIPIPMEYRLFNDFLWGQDYSSVAKSQKPPSMSRAEALSLLPKMSLLLEHPAFNGWLIQNEIAYYRAARLMTQGDPPLELKNFIQDYFDNEILSLYKTRLKAMSEWFIRAGDERMARLALAAAMTIDDKPPEYHPLLCLLAGQSLKLALKLIKK